MRYLKNPLLLVFLSFSSFAQTKVNLQEGSFHWTSSDRWEFTKKTILLLERSFSSRSTYQGILGTGWCSELEWTLIDNEAAPLLIQCDQPQVLKPLQLTRLMNQVRVKLTDRELFFDSEGRVEALKKGAKKWLVQRDLRGRPLRLQANAGEDISFLYEGASGFLKRLTHKDQYKNFTYERGLLVRAGDTVFETYRYDDMSNLVSILSSKGIWIETTYDSKRDLVLSQREDPGCLQLYEYQSIENGNRVIDRVKTRTQCPQKRSISQVSNFEYLKTHEGEVLLERVSSQVDTEAP